MTRRKILDVVPFDYVDSSSWRQPFTYARGLTASGKQRKVDSAWFKVASNRDKLELKNYIYGVKMQEHYYRKWRHLE